MKNNRIFLIIIYLSFCFFCTACMRPDQKILKGKPKFSLPEVEVIKVKKGNHVNLLKAPATLESPQTVELTSEVAGKIIYLSIPEGQLVNKGHVLARVNDTTNQAEIEITNAKLKNAKDNYDRMRTLKETGAISQQVLDNTFETLKVAQGDLNRVSSIQSMTYIVAPFSGVLSIKKVSLGQYIDPGDSIVRISQVNPMHILFALPEQYISQIMLGQHIKFTVSGSSKEYAAKIIIIDPYIDSETRTVQIKAITENPKRELLPGRFANLDLEVSTASNAILIPQEALIQDGNKKQIAIVDKNNKVLYKEVTIGNWDKDSILISGGILDGDLVITSGHQKLHPGIKVISKLYKPIHNQILDKEVN